MCQWRYSWLTDKISKQTNSQLGFFTEYISAILIWTKWQHKTYGKLSFVLHCTFYTQELYLYWSQIQWTDNNYLTYKYISHLTLRASCNMCLMNFCVQTRCLNSAASISTGRHKLQHEHEPQRGLSSKHTSIRNILLSNIMNTSILFTSEQQILFTWNVNFQYGDSVNTVRQFWYRKRQNYLWNGNKCGLMLSMACWHL